MPLIFQPSLPISCRLSAPRSVPSGPPCGASAPPVKGGLRFAAGGRKRFFRPLSCFLQFSIHPVDYNVYFLRLFSVCGALTMPSTPEIGGILRIQAGIHRDIPRLAPFAPPKAESGARKNPRVGRLAGSVLLGRVNQALRRRRTTKPPSPANINGRPAGNGTVGA